MEQKFENIIKHIIGAEENDESLSGINAFLQFSPEEKDDPSIARNLNAAFLILLSGKSHPLHKQVSVYFNDLRNSPSWERTVQFYKEGLELIRQEIADRCNTDGKFKSDLTHLYTWIINPESRKNINATVEKIFSVFFPEGVSLTDEFSRKEKITALRAKRKVRVSNLNPLPVTDPVKEVLFTSNVLVTIPHDSQDFDSLMVSDNLKHELKQIASEEQSYWYDHPVPVGIAPEHNEILYGLEELDKAVEFEKKQGVVEENDRLTCVLSASVTHEGLKGIVKEYLEDEFKKEKKIRHLNVYVFTESDTVKIINEVLGPAAEQYLGISDYKVLYEIFGVNGEYGRHYSFLRAISAYWKIFINPVTRGTFKIDLDQIFPQNEIKDQTGFSALEHFKTPLWGAEGIDSMGNKVLLGMIAGSLVNKKDIRKSLFYPDVLFPKGQIKADELIFFSIMPQALSTEAEMMTRYSNEELDGKRQCIQRIHVTGGTCGILINALRKYRPFTPTFIGRAEDQAYMLSVLFDDPEMNLRYLHEYGLVMRHDKEAFAGEAIKQAAAGKLIGDYIRILLFSYYVKALPWAFKDIKNTLDPFTGCFVSKVPLTVVYMQFALKTAAFFNDNTKENSKKGLKFLQSGGKRLHKAIQHLTKTPGHLTEKFQKEKNGWNLFYDILDSAENGLKNNDKFAVDLQKKAQRLLKNCKVNFTKE